MKKVLRFLVLSLALALFALPVLAEGLDLQAMSTDDLLTLQAAVNQELLARNFAEKEVAVPKGTYVVGMDIPAGVYTLKADDYASIWIYDDKGKHVDNHAMEDGESVGRLPLEEGWTVEVKYDSIIFTPYKGLGF